MARPRRDSNAPSAREALIDAFWGLLEKNQLHEISVGMVATAAGYNRGTFYYHFPDKDALVAAVVENELHDVPRYVFILATGLDEAQYEEILSSKHLEHLALFMEHGGRNIVEHKVKDYLVNMWTALLSPEGRELTAKTRLILEYMSSGMLGMLSYAAAASINVPGEVRLPVENIKEYAALALTHICEAQEVSRDEVVTRLQMLNQLVKVNQS